MTRTLETGDEYMHSCVYTHTARAFPLMIGFEQKRGGIQLN